MRDGPLLNAYLAQPICFNYSDSYEISRNEILRYFSVVYKYPIVEE